MAKRQRKKRFVTGLDVGTTKVCAIVGEMDGDGVPSILGVGSTPSLGLKKGIVIDISQTITSIEKAVQKASRMAGREVHNLIVGIAGGHVQCLNSRASIGIQNPQRGITRADITRVNERARALSMPLDREILHSIPQEYVTDNGVVRNPYEQVSSKLEVNVHIVTAAVTSVQNLMRCIKQSGYSTSDILLESIASAEALLGEEEKELGVLLLDIGGGTTDIAIFTRGHIRYTGVVPFGGDNITSDIARGLKISIFDAENIKKKYGCAMASLVRPEEKFEISHAVSHKRASVKRQKLAEIIEARVDEIFQMARERINRASFGDKFFGGVVLTGGTALLEGISDLVEKVFECPCRVGVPQGLKGMTSVISSPIYSTGIGLVMHGFSSAVNPPMNGAGLFEWVKNILIKIVDSFG